ncbi:hypothetical protein NQ314_009214 [Rhamnusium bicolor]|uniref:Uncharacterized protein n=1 Tax=Rhamnusium bicolor TaxID=1586634 RepID=A0AAV8Y4K1_9CUCU|nr:hypothetical protein NQ314_009214 [Rhamnusium bicolor]
MLYRDENLNTDVLPQIINNKPKAKNDVLDIEPLSMNFITVIDNENEYKLPYLNLNKEQITINTEKGIEKLEICHINVKETQENSRDYTKRY